MLSNYNMLGNHSIFQNQYKIRTYFVLALENMDCMIIGIVVFDCMIIGKIWIV